MFGFSNNGIVETYSLDLEKGDTTNIQAINGMPFTTISNGNLDFFSLNAPFMLQFETSHPTNEDCSLMLTTLSPDSSFYSSMSLTEQKNVLNNRHQHKQSFYELQFVIEGEMYQCIENQRHLYTPGCCCLFDRNVSHAEEFSTDFRAAFLALSYDLVYELFHPEKKGFFAIERNHTESILESFFRPGFEGKETGDKGYLDFIPEKNPEWVRRNMHAYFDEMSKLILDPQLGATMQIKALISKIMRTLDTPGYYKNTPIMLGTEQETIIFDSITKMMEATNGRVSRNELATKLNYSGDYLNKIVKKYTGLTIFDYGMTFCMNEAAKLLKESPMSVSEIANHLSFTNRAHFYKLFNEKFGVTPKEYRRSIVN